MDEEERQKLHPRRTVDLIGHERPVAELRACLTGGRLPHGWLIGGPSGIGKATLAYRFARHLLAGGGEGSGDFFAGGADDLYVSPEHPAFRQVASGGHPDLITIERTVSERTRALSAVIRVDQVRQLVHFFSLTAGRDGWRIAIVDGADEMNPNAANALLKVLEEPPERALLILVAHAPNRVIATIRSRCRKLLLRPLPDEQVAAYLAGRLPDLDTGDRMALARLSEGRPGRALALAGEGGLDAYRELIELFSRLPELDYQRLHALGDRLGRREQAAAFAVWMDLLALWLNRLVLSGAGRGPDEAVAGEGQLGQRLLAARGLDQWLGLWEKVCRLAARAESAHLDRKHVVLNAVLAVEAAARG